MSVAELVHRGDLDELVRAIDAAATRDDVDEVLALRLACLDAVEFSGRQLWGPAAYAAYRLALEAPPEMAVAAVLDADDRHMLGPLTEVVAQHHEWADLRDLLPPGPIRGTVAVERILRGDDLRGDEAAEVDHLDLPAHWVDWEGPRPRLDYRPGEVLAPAPVARPRGPATTATAAGAAVADPELAQAWEPLVAPWTASPDARVVFAVVDGPVGGAVGAVAPGREVTPIDLTDAVVAMTWAASSGGSARRRRGGAAGRSATWWALRTLVAHEPGSPPDDLEADLREWSWHAFGPAAEDGWWLRIAAEHPDGWSIAIDARDPPPPDLVLPVPEDSDDVDSPATSATPVLDPWADFDTALRDLGDG